MYINVRGKGRAPSARYKQWLIDAKRAAATQKFSPARERVRIVLHLDGGTKGSDCDNFCKAPVDFLVRLGIIEDDCKAYVAGVTAMWSNHVKRGVLIEIIGESDEEYTNKIFGRLHQR